LCLGKAYNSEPAEQEPLKRGYVLRAPKKRRKGEKEEEEEEEENVEARVAIRHTLNRKKHSARRWVVERTNSLHNQFRKLFTQVKRKR
jgi:hypothetical protein